MNVKNSYLPSITLVFVFTLFLTFIPASFVLAHKVIIFAWVEDGMIHSESSFGSNRNAKDSVIKVMDEKGRVIHEGKTDKQGKYSFKIPENTDSDLILMLEAGTGHKAQWRVPKNELLTPASDNDIKTVMAQKKELEETPSILKILTGIGLIFLMALAAKYLKPKKAGK